MDRRVCVVCFTVFAQTDAPARRRKTWPINAGLTREPNPEELHLRLTQYTDFSIRVLIYLGLHPDRRCTIQEIAERYNISRNHLMKVVQQLAGAGFVTSVRGSGGGLTLPRAADQINLADVVTEMEPDFAMVECFRENNECVITPACPLAPMLDRATRAFLDALREYTLADLLGESDASEMKMLLNSS